MKCTPSWGTFFSLVPSPVPFPFSTFCYSFPPSFLLTIPFPYSPTPFFSPPFPFPSTLSSPHGPINCNSSIKLLPFNRCGASRCTLSLARHATPRPAARNISMSLAPSPTAMVWAGEMPCLAARPKRMLRFSSGVMIGSVGDGSPVR